MKKSYFVSAVLAALLFSGCGGGSDSTSNSGTSTGIFADAPVQGLSYKTATQSGFTDAQGQFKYKAGETVEFKLGTLSLGKGKAGALVTPYTIADNNTTAINIALVLQNFDANRSNTQVLDLSKLKDYNFTDDINITAAPSALQTKLSTLLSTGSFQTKVDDTNLTLLTETEVKNNMDAFIGNYTTENLKMFTETYIAGKTFYGLYSGENAYSTYDFSSSNANQTFINKNTDDADYGKTLTGYHTGDGMIRVVDGELWEYTTDSNGNYNDGVNKYKISSIDDKKITATMIEPGNGKKWTVNFYFNQNDAEAAINTTSTTGFTLAMINGKTLYPVGSADTTPQESENDRLVFKDNGLLEAYHTYNTQNGEVNEPWGTTYGKVGSYVIKNGKLITQFGEGTCYEFNLVNQTNNQYEVTTVIQPNCSNLNSDGTATNIPASEATFSGGYSTDQFSKLFLNKPADADFSNGSTTTPTNGTLPTLGAYQEIIIYQNLPSSMISTVKSSTSNPSYDIPNGTACKDFGFTNAPYSTTTSSKYYRSDDGTQGCVEDDYTEGAGPSTTYAYSVLLINN